jgi:transcriptional regulator
MKKLFEPRDTSDLIRLIDEHPLAWIVSVAGAGFGATPLPLLAETDSSGALVSLLGHFALANPQVAQLRESPWATVLFSGPQGYISPEAVSQPAWAPTWNYAVARCEAYIEFLPDMNDEALERLVRKMEAGRREPWTVARVGERYAGMVRRIIAFRAHVRSLSGRFKLGQDETPQTLTEILSWVPDPALKRWMLDFNRGRDTSTEG